MAKRFRLPRKVLAIIRQCHDGMRARVWMDEGTCSDWLDVGQGHRQGCHLAPLMFNRFFVAMLILSEDEFAKDDEVMADMAMIKKNSREKGNVTMANAAEPLWGMLYADDAGIISRSPVSLEKMSRLSCAFRARSG